MSLALKVAIVEINQQRTMRFASTMSVHEACRQVAEKINISGEDHGFFYPATHPKEKPYWLKMDRTLGYYELDNGTILEYKKMHRLLKVRLLDNTQKKILIDDSLSVADIVLVLGEKLGLDNTDEFSLQCETNEGHWLHSTMTLHEQGVGLEDGVVLKKKFFVTDANVDTDNPAQVHFVYIQSRNSIMDGTHPTTILEAVQFAALESQINYANYNPTVHTTSFFKGMLKDILPPAAAKEKGLDKIIAVQWKKILGMSELNAKFRYIQLSRSLKTYGITCFVVNEILTDMGKKRLVAVMMGITRDSVLKMDPQTKEILVTFPLKTVRRWAAAPNSLTVDFGDHQDNYLSVQTKEAEAIAQLLAGYVDIILKKRKDTGRIIIKDDTIQASEESVAIPRSRIGTSLMSSASSASWGRPQGTATGGGLQHVSSIGAGGQQQQAGSLEPMARLMAIKNGTVGKQQICDLKTARSAIDDLLNELGTANTMLKSDPFAVLSLLGVPDGSLSSSSRSQLGHKLAIASTAVGKTAMKLYGVSAEDLSAALPELDEAATNLAREIAALLENAIMHASVDDKGSEGTLATAKALVEGARLLVSDIIKLKDFPGDNTARDALKLDMDMLQLAECFLRGTGEGQLIDQASRSLLEETAAALHALTTDIVQAANSPEIDTMIDDDSLKSNLRNATKCTNNASQKTLQQIQSYAATMLIDPSHHKFIMDAVKELDDSREGMMETLLECSGTDAADLLMNQYEAIAAGVEQLTVALQCVSRQSDGAPALAAAAKAVQMATAQLLSATTMASDELLFENAKEGVKDAMDALTQIAKNMAASASDKTSKQKLLQGIEAMMDAMKQLTDAAAVAVKHPNDPLKQEKVMVASQKLAMAMQQVVGDADRQAAVGDLLASVKETAASSSSLITMARAASLHTQRVDPKNSLVLDVFKNCKDTAEALAKLMAALKTSSSENIEDLPAIISELVAVSQQAAAPASNLVAVLKVNCNKIGSNTKTRADLRAKAEAVALTIQGLLMAAQQVIETSGIAEIAESVKQLEGVDAVIDAAILAASSGTLPVTPGLVEENAIELLSHATTGLAPPTLQLVEACRDPSTKQIGPSSRSCVSSMNQIVAASKTLASAFPKGQQQVNLLQSTKALVQAMEKMFVAARTASTHPGDPTIQQMLLAASRGVAEARTNVIRTAKGAHDPVSNQCDLAAESIRKESEKLKSSLFNAGNFNTFIDQLTTCAKAIQTASIQLSDSIHESGDALTASCQSTAALVPGLVEAVNNTAATAPKEDDKEAIVKAGNVATNALAGLVTAAKVSFLNKGDELSINGLVDANKMVDDSLTGLLNTCNSARPGQMESEAALDLISKSVAMLELSADYPAEADNELSKSPEHVKEVVSDAAKLLAGHSSQILATSRTYPEKAGQSALDAAKSISTILTAIKASTPRVEGLSEFSVTANEIEQLLKSVIENTHKPKVIIKGTKALAPLISDLMTISKKVASLLTDANAQQKLVKAAQQVHSVRNDFVNHAKAAAVKSPGSDVQLRTSAEDLQKAVDKLVHAASKVLPQEIVAPELKAQNDLLLSSSKGLAVATSQLILASKVVSSRPKDSSIHLNLAVAAKEVSGAIQSLLHATQGLAPDQIKCDEALESLSEIMENLDGLALTASVGGLVSYATISHDTARDDLARNALELGQAVSQMVTSALKKEAANLASAAGTTSDTSRQMLVAITAAASSTPERTTQKQLIALTKAVSENIYKLVEACKAAGTSSPEESQQRLADISKTTSEAIKGLIATLKLGVAGSKDCDEAVASISNIIKQLDEPVTTVTKKSFKQSKDELAIVAKAIAPAISKLVNVSKSVEDAGELGTAARAMSDTMPMLVAAVRNSVGATAADAAKSEIVDSGKAVANAARLLIQNAKIVAADRNNQVAQKKLLAAQVALNESVARLGSSMATGEMECESAANEIRNLISSLDAAALFAAAGQFEVTENSDSVEEIQSKLAKSAAILRGKITEVTEASNVTMEKLGTTCKDLTSNLSILIANCKAAAAQTGEIPLQQAVLGVTKTVAVSSRALVVAARDHCAAPESAEINTILQQSQNKVEQNVSNLLTEAQSAAQEALKGEKKMNATKAEILRLLDRFDEADNIGNQNASPMDVIESAKIVATATANVISSCNSSQDELLNNAKSLVRANTILLANAKGATRLTRDKNQQQNLLDAARRVAQATTKLFESLKTSNKNTVAGQKRLNDSSEQVANSISDVISSAGALPGADKTKMTNNIEDIAEAELFAAASAIEEAAAQLRSTMPVKKSHENEKEENWTAQELMVGDAVLDGTRSIANATAALVRAAGVLQKELSLIQGKSASEKTKFYRKDSIFTQGLISAAKAVAAATKQLVISANDVTQGMEGEEAVIAAAKGVAAATAQLVSSSRVKAGTDNPSQKKLQEAAKGVIGATSELVETAKGISSARDEEKQKKEAEEEAAKMGQEASNYSKSIVAEMEQQMRILKLEKELEKAREQLLYTRKKNYQ